MNRFIISLGAALILGLGLCLTLIQSLGYLEPPIARAASFTVCLALGIATLIGAITDKINTATSPTVVSDSFLNHLIPPRL